MKNKAQAGAAIIWGIGALLIAVGALLILDANTQGYLGYPEVALLESFLAIVLIVFGVLSFYMANR